MIRTDGRPTIAWADAPPRVGCGRTAPRVAKDREQYKRELAERTRRETVKALT